MDTNINKFKIYLELKCHLYFYSHKVKLKLTWNKFYEINKNKNIKNESNKKDTQ